MKRRRRPWRQGLGTVIAAVILAAVFIWIGNEAFKTLQTAQQALTVAAEL